MFQRIKGAIDSRIAEEQARQKALAVASVSRSPSSSRSDSRKIPPRQKREKRHEDGTSTRGPDPSEFENVFVLEDEDDEEDVEKKSTKDAPATAIPDQDNNVREGDGTPDTEENRQGVDDETTTPSLELPSVVRMKLRKLEKLETKYQELLRSYRVAHARAISIEPFEKQLRENTPLSTISDPDALGEYLNQLNLKGEIIMDELKRVSADRDDYKNKLETSQNENSVLREELVAFQNSKDRPESADSAVVTTPKMPVSEAFVKPSVVSRPEISSPKLVESAEKEFDGENLFSFDEEIPNLKIEVEEKTAEIEKLKSRVLELEKSLCTGQEYGSDLAASLEKAIPDLNSISESSNREHGLQEKIDDQTKEIRTLKDEIETSKIHLSNIKLDFETQKRNFQDKLTEAQTKFNKQGKISDLALKSASTASKEAGARALLKVQLEALEQAKEANNSQAKLENKDIAIVQPENKERAEIPLSTGNSTVPAAVERSKKKKNKKKKIAGSTVSVPTVNCACPEIIHSTTIANDLGAEIIRLKAEITEKDFQITRSQTKRKTEESLREELENMQENLLIIGQEHVEAKDKIKELLEERKELQEIITPHVSGLEDTKADSKGTSKILADLKALIENYEELKLRSATFHTDLGAAQQLASSRYRDLVDFRDALHKAQPELARLRTENANLKGIKEELAIRTSELKRLESKEKDLRADIISFKTQAADSQSEIRSLQENIIQEKNARLRAEDYQRGAQRDMRKSEAEKIQISAAGEKSASLLIKCEEEGNNMRTRIRDLEGQVLKLNTDSKSLREEVELRGSQYSNVQGLVISMRDEAAEMAMQLKEAKSQSESLSEELFEVQRLLSERTREAETMRRLLADVDDRADAKFNEMRERMQQAIEERDRVDDEASTNSRRRAREVDGLKHQLRKLEKDLRRNINEKEELKLAESNWKNNRNELELVSSSFKKEVDDIRATMNTLQDALDRSEKALREAEIQKLDLKKMLDDTSHRFDNLQKDYKNLQLRFSKLREDTDRNSIESKCNSGASAAIDHIYLKTIMLQFLEQKDRKVQESLIKTVLGQLLNFDKYEVSS